MAVDVNARLVSIPRTVCNVGMAIGWKGVAATNTAPTVKTSTAAETAHRALQSKIDATNASCTNAELAALHQLNCASHARIPISNKEGSACSAPPTANPASTIPIAQPAKNGPSSGAVAAAREHVATAQLRPPVPSVCQVFT